MGAQRSLGHFPFGGVEPDESQFDFIPDRKPVPKNKPKKNKSVMQMLLVKEVPKPDKTASETTTNGKGARVYEGWIESEKRNIEKDEKKVASYYLHVSLIDMLKNAAAETGESYSGYVEEAIRFRLKLEGSD